MIQFSFIDMKKYLTHLGSNISIVFGILSLLSFISKIASASEPGSIFIAGVSLLFGGIAYKSAKKRRLGQVEGTLIRRSVEVILCVLILASVLFQNDLKTLIITDPVPNLLLPAAAICAYLIEFFKTSRTGATVNE